MTNEKDREKAYGLPTHYDDGDLVDDIREKKHGSYGTEFDLDYPIACARVRQYCARIRVEAVKAERERCIIKIRSLAYEGKGMTNFGANKYNEALGDAEDAILSDDQEARNGTT